MIKKILWLMFVVEILSASNMTELERKIFPKNDQIVNTGTCYTKAWQCRDVNSGYVTEIIGFNFRTGTTNCKVYEETNMEEDLGINANRINEACIPKETYTKLARYFTNNFAEKYNQIRQSNITYVKNEENLNLTKFLTSLVVLNPNILDREKMKQSGKVELQNGRNFHSTQTLTDTKSTLFGNKDVVKDEYFKTLEKAITEPESLYFNQNYNDTSAIDGFNQNNMAYFSDLFLANEKIYQHLQILIFVLLGGFFVMQIGAKKFQAYLENRGENNAKEPYLHKFYIPIIMLGIFFMPIPEANGLAHSSIIQNIIRIFATHSNDLADMAHSIGAKTYINKIYKQIGMVDPNEIVNLAIKVDENEHSKQHSVAIFREICEKRYDKLSNINIQSFNFQTMTEEEKSKLREDRKIDLQQKSNTKENISKEACIYLKMSIFDSADKHRKYLSRFNTIQKNIEGEAGQKLNRLDTYFAKRNEQLGWIDAILIPSSAMLAETLMFADDSVIKYDMEKDTKTNIRNNQIAIAQGDVEVVNDEISDSMWGYITGSLVWMTLPAGNAIKDFIQDNAGKIGGVLLAFIGSYIPGLGTYLGGMLGTLIGTIAGGLLAYIATPFIMEKIYSLIPLMVCTTASLIAFMSYLVTLCKYFYISPFVVAFSFATRDFRKIISFLIAGLSIFFKPVLIVIFIYLALFLHTLIQELFVFLSVSQFAEIKVNAGDFLTSISITSIIALLKIFGYLASSYIIWKLIIGGPSWTLRLVGIDGKQDDMISSGLEQKLQSRAFVA